MAFVNEYIPAEDKKKYNMTADNYFYRAGADSWTVDRERDMFLLLRAAHGGAEGILPEHSWAFYWRGHLLDVLLCNLSTEGDERTSRAWSRKKVVGIGGMTPELEAKRSQIIADLRDALTVDREFGVLGDFKSYEVILDAE